MLVIVIENPFLYLNASANHDDPVHSERLPYSIHIHRAREMRTSVILSNPLVKTLNVKLCPTGSSSCLWVPKLRISILCGGAMSTRATYEIRHTVEFYTCH